ncbi:glycerol kinase [Piscinibacter sakaiensis]|uniref:FGGY family carbohydrate kinase n=1 Tax=Piscinibacter sakaiensis TaxID=1547922 RepID=UPI0037277926
MARATHLLALDQGTSSSRSIVFDREGRVVASAQRELTQHYPRPGWVEHDPMEIWATQRDTAREALARAGLAAADVAAIGITNQRETTLLWDRRSGEPVHPAIVWQDRRTEPICAALRDGGHAEAIRARTGLVVDPYFSGTKLQWLLDHVPGARARAEAGDLAFGTVDSWLLWRLTGGDDPATRAQAAHATDVSNASRTMLFDVHRNDWDEDLLALLRVPRAVLPAVHPSSGVVGHSAAGQACFRAGLAKNTYGTGCFLLMHTGDQFRPSANGLVSTAAAQLDAGPAGRAYALEGSVFIAGAVVQWLRDGLQAIRASADVQPLAESVQDAGGVMLVPAFTGLGAPYWQPEARGAIVGLTRGTTMAHIARAALESIAFQSAALLQAMGRDAEAAGAAPVSELRVDGGASVNDLLMQIQADLLGVPVVRPQVVETTALGAASLAGLAVGLTAGLDELAAQWRIDRRFEPRWPRERAAEAMARWEHAVRQTVAR